MKRIIAFLSRSFRTTRHTTGLRQPIPDGFSPNFSDPEGWPLALWNTEMKHFKKQVISLQRSDVTSMVAHRPIPWIKQSPMPLLITPQFRRLIVRFNQNSGVLSVISAYGGLRCLAQDQVETSISFPRGRRLANAIHLLKLVHTRQLKQRTAKHT